MRNTILLFLLCVIPLLGCSKYKVEENHERSSKAADHFESAISKTQSVVASRKVVCDQFQLIAKFSNSTLELAVATDLPDNTIVMVSVRRQYHEKYSTAAYSVDYFSTKSTIGQWRASKSIPIDNTVWMKALKAKQKKMANLGAGLEFEIGSISEKFTASMVIPINQENVMFGVDNKNLEGKAVTQNHDIRIIRGEVLFDHPVLVDDTTEIPITSPEEKSLSPKHGIKINPIMRAKKGSSSSKKYSQKDIDDLLRRYPKK